MDTRIRQNQLGGQNGFRVTDPRPFASSQIQNENRVVDLDTITTGTRKDLFLMQPQDSSIQQVTLSVPSDVTLSGPLNVKLVEAVDGKTVDLSEEFSYSDLKQAPQSFRANRAWSGKGAVYLAVTGTQQAVELNVSVEHMSSEVL